MDGREAAAVIEPIIRRAIERATAPLLQRIAALESRAPEKGEKGDHGQDGKDGADGAPGRDGKDADPALVAQLVDQAFAKIPAPKDGKDGAPGRDGIDGKDGKDVDAALIARMVDEAVAKIPAPKDGKDGRDGQPGVPGRDGKDGLQGKDGTDGKDGLGFEDLMLAFDGERTATLKFVRGDKAKELELTFPVVIDRGVYKEGENYQRGDFVSWGGSGFIAQRETKAKPETNSDWRLSVKRGRDGKNGKDGERGPEGPRGLSYDGQRH